MSEATEDIPPEIKDENLEVECSKPKRRRRGKKKRNKSGNSTVSEKQVESKNVDGAVKNHLEKKRKRRKLLIRPVDVPKAPENSTQFIIDDHDECHLYFNFERPHPFNERTDVEGADASNDAAFQDIDYEYHSMQDVDNTAYYLQDFELSYSNVRYEENMRLPKPDLVSALETLENRVRELERKLYEKDPNSALEQLQRKLLRLQEENNTLREAQQRLRRIVAGEVSSDELHGSNSDHSHHSGSDQLNEFNDGWSDSSDPAYDPSGDELFFIVSSDDSDAQSNDASDDASDAPSNDASDAPSDNASDVPSDVPSDNASDVPSYNASDVQSYDVRVIQSDDDDQSNASRKSSIHSDGSSNLSDSDNEEMKRIFRPICDSDVATLSSGDDAADEEDTLMQQDPDSNDMPIDGSNIQCVDLSSDSVNLSSGSADSTSKKAFVDKNVQGLNILPKPNNCGGGEDSDVIIAFDCNVVASGSVEDSVLDLDSKEMQMGSSCRQSEELSGANDPASKEEEPQETLSTNSCTVPNKPLVESCDKSQENTTSGEMV